MRFGMGYVSFDLGDPKGGKTPLTMYIPMDIRTTEHLGIRTGVMKIKGTTFPLKRYIPIDIKITGQIFMISVT